jgi:hypothetical protein
MYLALVTNAKMVIYNSDIKQYRYKDQYSKPFQIYVNYIIT